MRGVGEGSETGENLFARAVIESQVSLSQPADYRREYEFVVLLVTIGNSNALQRSRYFIDGMPNKCQCESVTQILFSFISKF